VLPDKLVNAAQTLREIAYSQSFEEDRLRKEREIVLHEIADAKDNPETRVQDMLLKSLFRTHPTGRPISGFSNTVKTISIKMIKESHRIHYAPQNTILVLTGRFNEDEKNSVLEKFADAPKGRFAQKQPLSTKEKKPEKKQTVQKRAGLAQTYMAIGARTVPAKHQNRYALDVINVLMGYGASSRLFIELREKNTLTYNVETRHHVGSDFGYFSVYCAVKKGKMEKTHNLIRREFEKMRTQKLPDKELRKCKDMIRGYVLRTLDDHLGCAGLLIEEETQFQNQQAIRDYLERIESVSAREIKEIANEYLMEDRFSTAILEPT
jgi:predicted Zn-dependent peptidase